MISGPNWARRYGPGHKRLCARPGCGAPAAATLRFQPTRREAWLVALDETRTEGDLCARHAGGLVLPRGWQLHNDLMADQATADRDPSAPAPLVAEVTAETSEALAETLDAQTPLLRRAFTNVRPDDNKA